MAQSKYSVTLEIAGPLAMFARPDTGSAPTSYPVPTWSAAKGILESIAFFADGKAWICPTKVEVCRPINEPRGETYYQRYTTNYGGPLRKKALMGKGLIAGGSSMQVFATVLADVCYRLHADICGSRGHDNNNAAHHLKDLFERRLKRGQCYRTPCLGWSEFTCSYWGPARDGITEVDRELNAIIPSMLVGVWNNPHDGQYEPVFQQGAEIAAGVLEYELPQQWLQPQGALSC